MEKDMSLIEGVYKDFFVEAKKGEQRSYAAAIIIAFVCLSTALNDKQEVVDIPLFGLSLPMVEAVNILILMYVVTGISLLFYSYKAYKIVDALEDNPLLTEALSYYPSPLSVNRLYKLIPLVIPVLLMYFTFRIGSEQHYANCLWASGILSIFHFGLVCASFEKAQRNDKG